MPPLAEEPWQSAYKLEQAPIPGIARQHKTGFNGGNEGGEKSNLKEGMGELGRVEGDCLYSIIYWMKTSKNFLRKQASCKIKQI